MQMQCNCQGCTKRTVGCHATCAEYKAFRAKCDKRLANVAKATDCTGFVVNSIYTTKLWRDSYA